MIPLWITTNWFSGPEGCKRKQESVVTSLAASWTGNRWIKKTAFDPKYFRSLDGIFVKLAFFFTFHGECNFQKIFSLSFPYLRMAVNFTWLSVSCPSSVSQAWINKPKNLSPQSWSSLEIKSNSTNNHIFSPIWQFSSSFHPSWPSWARLPKNKSFKTGSNSGFYRYL